MNKNECIFFTDLNVINDPVKIGFGANSYIYSVDNERKNKMALKIAGQQITKDPDTEKKNGADNILYEYFAGLYINSFLKRFPCFIQTLNLYNISKQKTPNRNITVKNATIINYNDINDITECNNINNTLLSLQYINAKTLHLCAFQMRKAGQLFHS